MIKKIIILFNMMSLTKFWLCRSLVELRQLRGLRRQVFMLASVPKERNLILLLFFATSMQRLQVSFRFGGYYMPSGFRQCSWKVFKTCFCIAFVLKSMQLFEYPVEDMCLLWWSHLAYLIDYFYVVSFRGIHYECGCCCTSSIL